MPIGPKTPSLLLTKHEKSWVKLKKITFMDITIATETNVNNLIRGIPSLGLPSKN